jgi:hypothetical protein
MRRFFGRFTWVPVLLILVGFVWFAIRIADPPEEAEREWLVTGTLLAADELKPDGPFVPYVALHKGDPVPVTEVPDFPLDDRQPDGSGTFELSADPGDGTRFFLFARFATAKGERFCATHPLPELRVTGQETWVVADTGKALEPQRLRVDKSLPCGRE